MSPLTAAFIEAGLRLGFAEEHDKNRPGPPGIGLVPLNAVDGVRVSTAVAYLMPNLNRPNLIVRSHTFVRRVLFQGTRAIGVEAESAAGRQEWIYAPEVILCSGAIGSPQLLMLSGVGPGRRAAGSRRARRARLAGCGEGLRRPSRALGHVPAEADDDANAPAHGVSPGRAQLQRRRLETAVEDMEIICGVLSMAR